MRSDTTQPPNSRIRKNHPQSNAEEAGEDSAGRSPGLSTLLISTAAIALLAGCDPPESECSTDSDCSRGQTCERVAEWEREQPVTVAGPDLVAPLSSTELPARDFTTITVSRARLLVDDEVVTEFEDGRVDDAEKRGGVPGREIIPLLEQLNTAIERGKQEATLPVRPFQSSVMIIADQTTPHRLLSAVMYTARQAGLTKVTLGVRRSNSPWKVTEASP